MKDRSPTTRSTGPPISSRVSSRMLVRSCTTHPVVALQRPRQLAVADVDRHHLARAVAQQHVGEPAGRGARVQAPPALHLQAVRLRTPPARRRACARPGRRTPGRSGSSRTTIATSVVTAGGRLGRPPRRCTLTRPAAISSLACSRERASPRRTSSASSRRRRGGIAASARRGVERAAEPLVGLLEHRDVLGDRPLLQGRRGRPAPRRPRPPRRASACRRAPSAVVLLRVVGCCSVHARTLPGGTDAGASGTDTPSTDGGSPDSSRCAHAGDRDHAPAVRRRRRHRRPRAAVVDPAPPAAQRRGPVRPARGRRGPRRGPEVGGDVRRSLLRRRGATSSARSVTPVITSRRVDPGVVGALDVGVQPVAHHQRPLAPHPPDRLVQQRPRGLAGHDGLARRRSR